MVEMYVGLLAGMIMLGLGGSSFTKDFAVRYLVYAFSVGMKLMALVMIARIGSEVLIGLAEAPTARRTSSSRRLRSPAFPSWSSSSPCTSHSAGRCAGRFVTGGMEAIRHGGQSASAGFGAGALAYGGARWRFNLLRGASIGSFVRFRSDQGGVCQCRIGERGVGFRGKGPGNRRTRILRNVDTRLGQRQARRWSCSPQTHWHQQF